MSEGHPPAILPPRARGHGEGHEGALTPGAAHLRGGESETIPPGQPADDGCLIGKLMQHAVTGADFLRRDLAQGAREPARDKHKRLTEPPSC